MAIDLLTAALASKLSHQGSSSGSTSSLPSVTSGDNGKVLGVVNGVWGKMTAYTPLASSITGVNSQTNVESEISYLLSSWIATGAQNPGAFTAATRSVNFDTSFFTTMASSIDSRLVVYLFNKKVQLCPSRFVGSPISEVVFHFGGTVSITASYSYYVSGDITLAASHFDVVGFVMPTTMTQAPILSGTYNSSTGTLNITGA